VSIFLRRYLWIAFLPFIIFAFRNSTQAVETSTQVEVVYGRPLLRTLESQLSDAGVTVYPEDRVKVFPDPSFGIGSKITIERAPHVSVNDGGTATIYRTWTTTIKDLFAEKVISLGELDRVEPAVDTPILSGATITVTRVAVTEITESLTIPFKTITRDDPNLLKGVTKVTQEGENGRKELKYRVTRENGVEIKRELLSESVVETAIDKIVLKGTKKVVVYGNWGPVVDEMSARYGANPDGLAKIMYCESGGNAASYNSAGPYYGLFQFHMSTWTGMGYPADDIYNGEKQIEAAAKKYPWRYNLWPACSKGT
jgi:hypothetical protein